jgi:membrane-bound serine protease (ClpP class)
MLAAMGLAMTALGPAAAPGTAPSTRPGPPGGTPAAVIIFRGEVNDYTAGVLQRHFAAARAAGAKAIILQIDTYGGTLKAGLETAQFLKRQEGLHVVAFVDPKAISAGTMIAIATHEITMSPFSKMGDVGVINVDESGKLQPLPQAERGKVESPAVVDFSETARVRGYDPLLLSAMVQVQVVVHYVQSPDGTARRFVDAAGYKALTAQGWKSVEGVPDPLDSDSTILTLDDVIAQRIGLSTGTYRSADAIAAARNWTIVARFEPGFGDHIIEFLNNPLVRGILLSIFLTALYVALHTPGHGFPEVIAFVTLAALLGVPLLTGYAQWWEILMILGGLALLAVEVFVLPGFGVAGIAGIVLVLLGFILTFAAREPIDAPGWLPSLPSTWAAIRQGLIVVVCGMLASLLLSMWLRRFLPKLPYFSKLILTATVGASADGSGRTSGSPAAPAWPAIGAVGRAVTELKPGGSAEFADGNTTRVVSVVSDSGFVEPGASVVVRELDGPRIAVRKAG